MITELFARFDGAFAENTLRAYRADLRHYQSWCEKNGIPSLPAQAEILARYVDELSLTHKSATIRRRINSLGTVFKLSKNADPTKAPEVVLALKRMHRKIGRQQAQATPLTRDVLDKLLLKCGDDARGLAGHGHPGARDHQGSAGGDCRRHLAVARVGWGTDGLRPVQGRRGRGRAREASESAR